MLYICLVFKPIKEMETYIANIIKTGLANGATLEQMMANPELAHKAYLDAQLRALDKAKETISLKRIGGIVAG